MHSNRQKNLLKAARENFSQNTWKIIPDYYSFVSYSRKHRVKIAKDDYTTLEQYSESNDNLPFVILDEDNYKWLSSFASKIVSSPANYNVPLLNHKLDIKNPGICAFRLYTNPDENGNVEFIQVQVHKCPEKPYIYQLDYFEENSENKMIKRLIGLCDVSGNESIYDLVYNNSDSPYDDALDMLSKVVCLFRSILIYMRIWDYDMENISKVINIAPMYAFKA